MSAVQNTTTSPAAATPVTEPISTSAPAETSTAPATDAAVSPVEPSSTSMPPVEAKPLDSVTEPASTDSAAPTTSEDKPVEAAPAEKAAEPSSPPKKSSGGFLKSLLPGNKDKKEKKSRSSSRGLVDRIKQKKDETEVKHEEKKAEKEEKKIEKEEAKEDSSVPETATTGAAVTDTPAEAPVAAPVAAETTPAEKPVEKPVEKHEEAPKNKRNSIFSRFGGLKSPSKEKDQKDAELKPAVPPKDDAAPQIPAPSTETAPIAPAVQAVEPETPAATEAAPAEEPQVEDKKDEVATPSKEKPKLLSQFSSFMNRNRSVSPSATKKDEPVKSEPLKTETESPKETVPETLPEPVKTEEPVAETSPAETSAVTAAPETSDKTVEPATEATKEAPKEEKATDATANKRTSVFGGLGRRASKAFKGLQSPRKENATPVAVTEKKETTSAAEPAADKPIVNGDNTATAEEAKLPESKPITEQAPAGPAPVAASA